MEVSWMSWWYHGGTPLHHPVVLDDHRVPLCIIQALSSTITNIVFQGKFQDPKTEVLYHIRPWEYIPLHSPYIGLVYGRYLQFGFLEWPLNNLLTYPAW